MTNFVVKRTSNMNRPNQTTEPRQLIVFFIITFAIAWSLGALAIFLPGEFQRLFGELTDTNPIYYVAVAAPTISATLITASWEGLAGLRRLYARLIHWRFGIQWYALVLVGIPALGWLLSQLTGSSPLKDISNPKLLFTLLLTLLISGPLGEELGWRGYALPHLLRRFSPFVASLILGAIWGAWHLPSFFLSAMVQSGLSLPIFLLIAPCLAILMTWVFIHTRGSVLICILIHYMVNFSASVIGMTQPVISLTMLAGAILVVGLDKKLGWFRKVQA